LTRRGEIAVEKKEKLPINHFIRAKEVRVITDDGEQLGILPLEEAIRQAEARGLDLVEVAETATPPVCRIMDFGKFKYQLSKKAQVAKKKQKVIQVKEIKIRPKTDTHDLAVKAGYARRFLEEGNKIKVTVMYRGREIVHADRGHLVAKKLLELLTDISQVEQEAKLEGRNLTLILSPKH
jgi:translation initiation factor IF-3